MTNLYWPSVVIQNAGDDRAWVSSSSTPELSLKDALKIIEQYKENNVVLCAWVRKQRKNVFKGAVWFECYTNALGMVNDRWIK